MIQHYTWPDLGEEVVFKHLRGRVVARVMGEMFFTIHNYAGDYYNIDLAEFILDQIRNPV